MNQVLNERAQRLPVVHACQALSLNRSTLYARQRRLERAEPPRRSRKDAPQPRALSPAQRQDVLDTLHSEEFRDQPPVEVYAQLLEQGRYLCSVSTMHRVLRAANEHGERRQQRPAQHHAVPRPVTSRHAEAALKEVRETLAARRHSTDE